MVRPGRQLGRRARTERRHRRAPATLGRLLGVPNSCAAVRGPAPAGPDMCSLVELFAADPHKARDHRLLPLLTTLMKAGTSPGPAEGRAAAARAAWWPAARRHGRRGRRRCPGRARRRRGQDRHHRRTTTGRPPQ
jgi:hypothetical protein